MTGIHRLSRRAFGAGALVSGMALPGAPARAQETPRRGGTLVATWGGFEPPACYVPTGGGYGPTFTSSKIFERLARGRMDGSYTGLLAESWTPSADYKSYTLVMRQGVLWHDGRPMTAGDIVFSINELWRKYAIAPAMRDFTGVEATDATTVAVRFSQPVPEPYFAAVIGGVISYIVPKHIYGGTDMMTNAANNAPVGTGPWKFKQWVRGSHMEFARNETYWQKGLPYLDRLILRFQRDPASRAAALEAGEIQLGIANPTSHPEVKRLTAGGKLVATTEGYAESSWVATLECNMRNPLFAKREVRQAIFHALDRAWIARTVYYGYARPATGPIHSNNKAFYTADTPRLDFDPRKSAALLDAAGLPKKADGKRFTVNLVSGGWSAELPKVGAYAKQALEDIGVGVTFWTGDFPTSIKRIYTDYDFDIAVSSQVNPTEPVPWTTRFFTTDGIRKGLPFYNASGYSNPELDGLVEKMRIEIDPARRKALVGDFQRFIAREAVMLPLVEFDSVTLASPAVRNHSREPNFLGSGWGDLWLAG